MLSKQLFLKVSLSIGLVVLIIGLLLFSLYTRRRFLLRTSRNIIPTREEYTHIDLEDPIHVSISNNDKYEILDNIIDKDLHLVVLKKSIVDGKQQLKDLSDERRKYNKLIVDKKLDTHSIVGNTIIYTPDVIKNYPELHEYLIRLHKVQDILRKNVAELDIFVVDDNKIDSLMYRMIVQKLKRDLIDITYKLKNNRYNKKEMLKKNPLFLNLEGKLLIDDASEYPIKGNIKTYLTEQSVRLRTNKLELENKLHYFKLNSDLFEYKRLNY